jgi:hypothetical protein
MAADERPSQREPGWCRVRITPSEVGAEAVKVELAQRRWVAKAKALPRKGLVGAIAQVKKRYTQLKNRHGPTYTKALLVAAFVAFFLPVPGILLLSIALLVVIAEIHRAISKRGGFSEAIATLLKRAAGTYPRELVMSKNCDVILQWSATPEQLRALGTALWRWCNRAAGNTGIYQYLDNQALADLIAGKLPASSQTEGRGVHLWVRDEASPDRQATIDSLRREIPAKGSRISSSMAKAGTWRLMASLRVPSAPRGQVGAWG